MNWTRSSYLTYLMLSLASLAISGCVSQSSLLTNSEGQSVTCAHAGFGWLGAPIALAAQADCVSKAEAAGFKERPSSTASPASKPSSDVSTKLSISLPAGWERQALAETHRNGGLVIMAVNKTTDSFMTLSAAKRNDITDMSTYVASRYANQASRLQDATQSAVEALTLNKMPAWRTEITGVTRDGVRSTFLMTILDGGEQVVILNTWTTQTNFVAQRPTFVGLIDRISGV